MPLGRPRQAIHGPSSSDGSKILPTAKIEQRCYRIQEINFRRAPGA
jgi:hypothetical protein